MTRCLQTSVNKQFSIKRSMHKANRRMKKFSAIKKLGQITGTAPTW